MALFTLTFFLFLAIRFILPAPLGKPFKIVLFLFLLLVSQVHLINVTFFGTLASPELPAPVIALQGGLFAGFLMLVMLVLARDIVAVARRLLSGARPGRPPLSRSAGVFFSFSLAVLVIPAFGVWQAVRVPDVNRVEIALPGLPEQLDGLRVVQLTDIHASHLLQERWVRAVVDKTNALHPDLVLITGDMVDGTIDMRMADVTPLGDLRARYGTFAIPGNHEYYSGYEAWMNVFSGLGLTMLPNRHKVVDVDGAHLVIAGLTDHAAARFGLPEPDPETALANAPESALTILMAHQPRDAALNALYKVDVQLSGHTHGGQIAGFGFLVERANNGFVKGLYEVDGVKLYVSNGTGLWNGFPVRLGRLRRLPRSC